MTGLQPPFRALLARLPRDGVHRPCPFCADGTWVVLMAPMLCGVCHTDPPCAAFATGDMVAYLRALAPVAEA